VAAPAGPSPEDGSVTAKAQDRPGVPATAEAYQLNRPELPDGIAWDEGFEKAALPVAHRLGLTAEQVQGLLDFYAGHQVQSVESSERSRFDDHSRSVGTLKSEWGPSYDTRVAQAARAARYFGGDSLIAFLNDSGAGNNPDLVRAFARIGATMSEDRLKGGSVQTLSLGPDEALQEARRLMLNPGYARRDHPEHTGLVERVQALFELAYADRDAV